MDKKLIVINDYAYRGGVKEKRLYGGQGTITVFQIGYEYGKLIQVAGHGPHPATRRSDAIRRFHAGQEKTG